MNILDENIPESQRQLLRSWRIRVRQIGYEVGRQGTKDERIIPLLHRLRYPTFFTRDLGFYDQRLCHVRYCLVCLAVGQYETASFIRRFLRHAEFKVWSKRKGQPRAARLLRPGRGVYVTVVSWRLRTRG